MPAQPYKTFSITFAAPHHSHLPGTTNDFITRPAFWPTNTDGMRGFGFMCGLDMMISGPYWLSYTMAAEAPAAAAWLTLSSKVQPPTTGPSSLQPTGVARLRFQGFQVCFRVGNQRHGILRLTRFQLLIR